MAIRLSSGSQQIITTSLGREAIFSSPHGNHSHRLKTDVTLLILVKYRPIASFQHYHHLDSKSFIRLVSCPFSTSRQDHNLYFSSLDFMIMSDHLRGTSNHHSNFNRMNNIVSFNFFFNEPIPLLVLTHRDKILC